MNVPRNRPPHESTDPGPFKPLVWVATGAGVGFLPYSPGTWGSVLGLPLALALHQLPGWTWQLIALAAIALAGVPICAVAARHLGRGHDPGNVILDEIVGMAATLFLFDPSRPAVLIVGFVLFRIFDILKPSPVREIERLPHGWGIMADDLVAAVYANFSLRLIALIAVPVTTDLLPLM